MWFSTTATFHDAGTATLALSDLCLDGVLDLLNHYSLKTESWGESLFELATALLIGAVVPLLVSLCGDFEFNRVVTSSDSREVPFELLDLAALVEVLEDNNEEQTDQRSSCGCDNKMVVLGGLVCFVLNACVLHEKQVCRVCAFRIHSSPEEV